MEAVLADAAAKLATARSIVVLSGAGTSKASGIATFREAQTGLWSRFDPAELASEAGFRRNPARVWQWYQNRREQAANAHPNAAHRALVDLDQLSGKSVTIITQNVDGLHQAAGSRRVVEYHGNLHENRCINCERRYEESTTATYTPPKCPTCNEWIRPGVVWFGEAIAPAVLRASAAALSAADMLLSVGTAALVYPAADMINQALRQGTPVLEINPDQTPFTEACHWAIRGEAELVLPRLIEALAKQS